ncbi:MAG TPA: DUF4350 domain-containing protein [Methanocella sp.]|jgi:hypothetical protein
MRAGTKVLLVAVVLALLLIAGKLFLSEASFSPANPSWDGVSSVMTDSMRPLYGLDQLPQDGLHSTLLIVGPSVNYTAGDAGQVQSFLQRGGRVVVLDDFGTANSLLQNISSPIAIDHRPVCQDVEYYKKATFPTVSQIEDSSLTANVSRLVFNHPALLQVSGDATVLARTTTMGWLDVNDNGILDGDEKFGSYPLVARASRGAGELFVAADADLAINSMQDMGDNRIFIGNILQSGTVYLDVAHGQQVPPLAWLYYTIKYNIVVQILFALLIFISGYAYLMRGRIFRRREPEESQPDTRGMLIASMKARLPLNDREIKEIKKKL